MEDISKYIRELLFTRDLVSVKGLGAFMTTYKPAGKNPVDNTFSPPAKILRFSKSKDEENDFLINKIALSKNITYEESESLVKSFVDNLLERIDRGERIHLNDIGYFEKNEHKKITFEPHHISNFLANAYGLDEVAASPLKKHTSLSKKHTEEKPAISIPAKGKNKKFVYFSTGIILVFFIAAAAYFTGNIKPPFVPGKPSVKNLYQQTDQLLQEESHAEAMKDSLSRIEKKLDKLTQKETALKPKLGEGKKETNEVQAENKKTTPVSDFNDKGARYYLVAGSFKHSKNAQDLVQELANEGYTARIYESKNNFYRVVIDSFTQKKNAISAVQHIRTVKGKESVWVLYE
jgi:nucleoid DNA-binding protein